MSVGPLEQGFLVPTGRTRLYARWRASTAARAVVVIIHGFGEHGGRYEHVMEFLASRDYASLAVDYRGFGRAGGRRAFVQRFDDYLDDVSVAIEAAREAAPGAPLVLLGHSMGGLITALFATDRDEPLDALVLSGPAIRFAMAVPAWKRWAARALNRIWPTFSNDAGIEPERLTHDAQILDDFRADPLRVRSATVRWYTESLAAQQRIELSAHRVTSPLLVLLGREDRIVDAASVERFFSRCGATDKELRGYDGLYHELFNEARRDVVLADLGAWLDARMPATAGGSRRCSSAGS